MINIKVFFGHELKIRVKQKVMEETIGEWAHTFYLSYLPDIDLDFRELLLTISNMELGSEFYFTYEELDKIADDLIAEREVKLDDKAPKKHAL